MRIFLSVLCLFVAGAVHAACDEKIPGIVGAQVNSQTLMARMNGAMGGDIIRAQREMAVSTNLMPKLRTSVVAKLKDGCLSVHPIEQSATPRDFEVVVSVVDFASKETGAQIMLRAGTMGYDPIARGINDGIGRSLQAKNMKEAGENITDGTFIIQKLDLNAELVCGKKIHEVSVSGDAGDNASSSAVRKLAIAVREKILSGCGVDPVIVERFRAMDIATAPVNTTVVEAETQASVRKEGELVSPARPANPVEAFGTFIKGIADFLGGGGQETTQPQAQ